MLNNSKIVEYRCQNMEGSGLDLDRQRGDEKESETRNERRSRSRSPRERRSRSPVDKDRTSEQDDKQNTASAGSREDQLQARLKVLSDEPAIELSEDEKLMMSVMGFHSFNTTKRIFDEPVETRADDEAEGDGNNERRGGYVDRGRSAYRGNRGGYRDQGSSGGYGRGGGSGRGGNRGGYGGGGYEGGRTSGGGYGGQSHDSGGYGGGSGGYRGQSNYSQGDYGTWHANNY